MISDERLVFPVQKAVDVLMSGAAHREFHRI
jgi:hypothetical protein